MGATFPKVNNKETLPPYSFLAASLLFTLYDGLNTINPVCWNKETRLCLNILGPLVQLGNINKNALTRLDCHAP